MTDSIPEEWLALPRTKAEAKAAGAKFYFTGNPCKHGNLDLRGVKSPYCHCRACREERNGRSRTWRADNPEKQAESTRNWQLNNWEAQQEVWRRAEKSKQERDQADPEYKAKRRDQSRTRSLNMHHRRYGTDEEYTEGSRPTPPTRRCSADGSRRSQS